MRIELQPAYVIHSRPFRDSSLIVDFFTPQYGRLGAIVKGVRSTSKAAKLRRSLIQPFMPLLISFGGKSTLKTLFHCEAQKPAALYHGDKLFSAMYVNELLMRLVKTEEDSGELFTLYQRLLSELAGNDEIESVLRRFEFSLLDCLGYGLSLEFDSQTGDNIVKERYYQFVPEQGFHLYVSSKPSKDVFNGADIIAINNGENSLPTRSAAKRLCRQALGFYLGDKPLKSRELFV